MIYHIEDDIYFNTDNEEYITKDDLPNVFEDDWYLLNLNYKCEQGEELIEMKNTTEWGDRIFYHPDLQMYYYYQDEDWYVGPLKISNPQPFIEDSDDIPF